MATRVEAQTSMSVSWTTITVAFSTRRATTRSRFSSHTTSGTTRPCQQGYYLFAQAMSTPPRGAVDLTEGLAQRAREARQSILVQLPRPVVPPRGDRGRQGGARPVRTGRRRLADSERHDGRARRARAGARPLQEEGSGDGLPHRLQHQRRDDLGAHASGRLGHRRPERAREHRGRRDSVQGERPLLPPQQSGGPREEAQADDGQEARRHRGRVLDGRRCVPAARARGGGEEVRRAHSARRGALGVRVRRATDAASPRSSASRTRSTSTSAPSRRRWADRAATSPARRTCTTISRGSRARACSPARCRRWSRRAC